MTETPSEQPVGPGIDWNSVNHGTVFEAVFPGIPWNAPWMKLVKPLLMATFHEHFDAIVLTALKAEAFTKKRAELEAAGENPDQADLQWFTPEEAKEFGISEGYAEVLQEWVFENESAFRELIFRAEPVQQQEAEEVAAAGGWSRSDDPEGKTARFVKTIQGLNVIAVGTLLGTWLLFDIKAANETSAADAVICRAPSFPALVDGCRRGRREVPGPEVARHEAPVIQWWPGLLRARE